MKLRGKLTLFAVLLIAAAIAASCLIVFSFSRKNAMNGILSAGVADYERLYKALEDADRKLLEADGYIKDVYVKYHFSNLYGANEFALHKGGETISNNTGVDAQAVLRQGALPVRTEAYSLNLSYQYVSIGGRTYFVAGGDHAMLGDTYALFLVRDVTGVFLEIDLLAAKCIGLSAIIIVAAALLTSLLIYRSLKPLEGLHQGAKALKNGDYASRISVRGKNEIAELADSFNSMADAIQRHIGEIEATSEERKLLLSALSHEMKTPVTVIHTCAYSLTHTKMSEEQTREAILFIDAQCSRLERFSGKLAQLISMRGEGMPLTELSIDGLAGELRVILNPIAEQSGITLAFHCLGNTLRAEKDLMLCVVSNLFDNARKAGALRVHIYISEREISVTDNGKGIPQEHIKNVTQPFYVIDKSRNAEGYGLGLALVKRVAELHRAELIIESEAGTGTSVTLHFYPYNAITSP